MPSHPLWAILRTSLCTLLLLTSPLTLPPAIYASSIYNFQSPRPRTSQDVPTWAQELPQRMHLDPERHHTGHRNLPSPQTPNTAPRLPAWWAVIQTELRRREYHVTWQERPLLPGDSPGYQAPNRAHNLRLGFAATGIHVVPRTVASPPWHIELALARLGTPTLSVDQNQVTYRQPDLIERYINDERGLLQIIDVIDAKTTNRQTPLILELALAGDLSPQLVERAIHFITADGTPVLRYSPPHATDTAGRPIPVRFQLNPNAPRTIHLIVDSPAHIPVSIRTHLTALPPTADWIGESDQENAGLGYSLSTAGDVNGDGYSDLVVGTPWYDNGQVDEGATFIYHGSAAGLEITPAWRAEGNQENAHLGHSVAIAGDVDGDGYADVAIGAPHYDVVSAATLPDAGQITVYHGGPTGVVTGTAQWTATGDQENAHFGATVSTAGDLNGDGYSDLIVGAPDHNSAGAAFVYLGGPTGLASSSAVRVVSEDHEGQMTAQFGASVSTAGDVNGDGYSDIIAGAPGYDGVSGTLTLTDTGRAYVYLGSPTGVVTSPVHWTVTGDQTGAQLGISTSTAGDVDGDGYTDVIIGAPGTDIAGATVLTDAGQTSVYYGGPTGLVTDTVGWTVAGDQENAHFGAAVAVAGDLNSDGYADVVIGAPDYDDVQPDEGAAYVYYGGRSGLSSTWVVHPTDQPGARFGISVSPAGDVNGDGHGDLAIGSSGYDHEHTDEGGAFVYHGSPGGLAADWSWRAAGEDGGALLGWAVSTAGDVNGDGYSDVIVGIPRYDNGQTEEGAAFLYTGGPGGPSTTPAWTGESNQEWARFGEAVAAAGDVNNDGYGDIIIGAPHYDNESLDDGRAFVYYGGPQGPVDGPADWFAPPEDQGTAVFGISARFGYAVATAGDVNGDGYSDVIVTANGYDAEETNEGAAFVYHGGPFGLASEPAWTANPTDQAFANFGRAASTAGDVNGDGYSDIVVGAPWYDVTYDPNSDIQDEGAAYAYYGSVDGLSPDPTWTVIHDHRNAEFGLAVATAGDVNGDGYSDIIIGAYKYTEELYVTPWREGAAFVYHGGPDGLITGPANWSVHPTNQKNSKFGVSVATAGDVDGDGYSDVVTGAPSYTDSDETPVGAAFVYHGGPDGLTAGEAGWTVQGKQEGEALGFNVSTAGDVNGDGYSDVIVGAPTYNDRELDEGAALIYLGNGGGGLSTRVRQMRSDGSHPIAPLGRSNSANQMNLQLTARSPLGRESAALQWQMAPLGQPFSATTIFGTTPAWREVLTTGVVLSQTVNDLAAGIAYRWRARALYRSGGRLGQAAGPWLYLSWNGPQEMDFRTPRLLAPSQSATIQAEQTAIYTHTLTNPISQTQGFTLTAISSQAYSATVATPLGGPTVTLPAFGCSPVTVTVRAGRPAIVSTDTTTVTAISGYSGYDTVYDVTRVEPARSNSILQTPLLPLILRPL